MVCTVNLWDCILFRWNIFLVGCELKILAFQRQFLPFSLRAPLTVKFCCLLPLHTLCTWGGINTAWNESGSIMKTITSQFTHTAWNPSLSCRLLTQSGNQILFLKLKLTRLGCKESFRYNLYIGQKMAYKLYFTSCINKLGLHCITYYMGTSQKDWKQTNSRIWLAKIDLDRGLVFPIHTGI